MNAHESTESGLSQAQEDELRLLLQRAADSIDVATPDAEVLLADGRPGPSRSAVRSSRSRWVLGAVAAAAVLLAGTTWFASTSEDGQQVASGGTEAPDDGDAAASTGMWRWPETLPDGLEVTEAVTTSGSFTFQIAVDDPAAPTRWLAISPTWFGFSTSGAAPVASGTLESGATYAVYEPTSGSTTGATWAELAGVDGAGHLTIAALGVDHQAIINMLDDVSRRAGNLTDVEAMDAALAQVELPDGLQPAWNPDRIGFDDGSGPASSLSFVLGRDGNPRPIGLVAEDIGVAPAVASLDMQLLLDVNNGGEGDLGQNVTRRDDLGLGTLVIEADGETTVYRFTEDGVRLMASDLTGASTPPLGISGLVGLLDGFRAVPESEVRTRLDDLGVQLRTVDDTGVDSGSGGSTTSLPAATTTVVGSPGPEG